MFMGVSVLSFWTLRSAVQTWKLKTCRFLIIIIISKFNKMKNNLIYAAETIHVLTVCEIL
jgi:hypothetical protein